MSHSSTPAFKLALGQIRVEPADVAGNMARAVEAIAEAAEAGAQIVLLPEALPFGWTDPSAIDSAQAVPGGEHCRALQEAAGRCQIHVCAGLVERAGPCLFNAAVLIGPKGDLLAHHRKINELDIAQDLYARGDRLGLAHTSLGTIGVMICADAFAPGQVISRTLALMGARVILSPCAWAVPADHDNATEPYGKLWLDNYCPVSREFGVWIAGCSNVGPITAGPWKGRKCIGCSMAVNPAGDLAVSGPYGEGAAGMLYTRVR